MRVALGLEYFGGAFHGWQSQAGGGTVQDALEASLEKIVGAPVSTLCAGRTDAGVHANLQVVHFDTQVERPLSAWVRGVNTHLPEAISVRWAKLVDEKFHARFSAQGRRYRYLLASQTQRLGLWHGRLGWTHHALDLLAMQQGATLLVGEHDFSAFRAAACQAKSPVKTLWKADVRQVEGTFVFDFEASAFLHHMVRNLVGSLVYVGMGKYPPEWIGELLMQRNRQRSAPTFSPDGLYFRGPIYDACWDFPAVDESFSGGVLP